MVKVRMEEDDMDAERRGVFAISVAAERADLPIQNLRVYERRGKVLELEAELSDLRADTPSTD
jgi:hypothetical protein